MNLLAESALNFRPSPERKTELYQTNTQHNFENFGEPGEADKKSLLGLSEMSERAVQTATSCLSPVLDSKASIKLLSPSRRGSEVGGVLDPPSVFNLPGSPSELSMGKRVRKLKKRKVLKKAQGTEQPESSDTDIEGETSKPRWLRPRRRPSGGSQVSTSTQQTEDREGDLHMDSSEDVQKTSHVKIEPPDVSPAELTATLDSEENMEVSAACQQPHVDVPDSSRPEPQSLACNEVTSTSDMEICKSSER